jgi:hypothetical protein
MRGAISFDLCYTRVRAYTVMRPDLRRRFARPIGAAFPYHLAVVPPNAKHYSHEGAPDEIAEVIVKRFGLRGARRRESRPP